MRSTQRECVNACAQEEFPAEALRKAAALGFAGVYCADKYGGSGMTRLEASLIYEALAHSDVSTTAYLSIHKCAVPSPFASHHLPVVFACGLTLRLAPPRESNSIFLASCVFGFNFNFKLKLLYAHSKMNPKSLTLTSDRSSANTLKSTLYSICPSIAE